MHVDLYMANLNKQDLVGLFIKSEKVHASCFAKNDIYRNFHE